MEEIVFTNREFDLYIRLYVNITIYSPPVGLLSCQITTAKIEGGDRERDQFSHEINDIHHPCVVVMRVRRRLRSALEARKHCRSAIAKGEVMLLCHLNFIQSGDFLRTGQNLLSEILDDECNRPSRDSFFRFLIHIINGTSLFLCLRWDMENVNTLTRQATAPILPIEIRSDLNIALLIEMCHLRSTVKQRSSAFVLEEKFRLYVYDRKEESINDNKEKVDWRWRSHTEEDQQIDFTLSDEENRFDEEEKCDGRTENETNDERNQRPSGRFLVERCRFGVEALTVGSDSSDSVKDRHDAYREG